MSYIRKNIENFIDLFELTHTDAVTRFSYGNHNLVLCKVPSDRV